MCKIIFVIAFLVTWPSGNWTAVIKSQDSISLSSIPRYAATSFDYDYGIEPRSSAKQRKSNPTTTVRPIVRYWNSFMRNVRIPLPSLTWNMTNPLSNLFNAGAVNILETPVGNPYTNSSKRKRKQSRKRKNHPNRPATKRIRDRRIPYENGARQQLTLAQYPSSSDPNLAMYYDPNTHHYYEVKRVDAHEHYLPQYQYYNYLDGYYNDAHQPPQHTVNTMFPEQLDDQHLEDDEQLDDEPLVDEQLEDEQLDDEQLDDEQLDDEQLDEEQLYDHQPDGAQFDDDQLDENQQWDDDDNFGEEHDEKAIGNETTPNLKYVDADKSITAATALAEDTTDVSGADEGTKDETLRNAIGSYMEDNSLNRKRQRFNKNRTQLKYLSGKSKPRDTTFKYYFLKGW